MSLRRDSLLLGYRLAVVLADGGAPRRTGRVLRWPPPLKQMMNFMNLMNLMNAMKMN